MRHTDKKTRLRISILIFSTALSLTLALIIYLLIPEPRLQLIRLTQSYALTAVFFLYLTLLATPLIQALPTLPFAGNYIHARRSLGLSACYFALLHGILAFFGQLGGFEGIFFLSARYLLALSLSTVALFFLLLMSATSYDRAIQKIGYTHWKRLHRIVYFAALLILLHALMLGSHFQHLSRIIPQLMLIAVFFLLFLESLRVDRYLQKKFRTHIRLGPTTFLILCGIITFEIAQFTHAPFPTLSIHEQHVQTARQLASQQTQIAPQFPWLKGDPTKRYTIDIDAPSEIQPGDEVTLRFQIFDAQSGTPVQFFQKNYERLMHLVSVNSDFTDFNHIHPVQTNSTFTVTTSFPKNGIYRIYLSYQPLGSIEQHAAFSIPVGNGISNPPVSLQQKKVATANGYQIILTHPTPLIGEKLSVGEQTLTFTIRNARTKKPIRTLGQYLGAFGHLVMIDEKTYDYLHVHPVIAKPLQKGEKGGPEVVFSPLGLTSVVKPGTYRLFLQLNPNGTIQTTEFLIQIK